MLSGIRTWLRPPRAHGEVIEDRTVSFLELFYDLIFVVLVAQIAHTLADDVSWTGVRDFMLVFALIWMAWANGTLYHELHGGEDGRSRSYIFIQMSLLVVLSVYAGHATSDADDGRGFAVAYTLLLALIGWQWFDVRRHDTREMRSLATSYIVGVVAATAVMAASAFVADNDIRLMLWLIAGATAVATASIALVAGTMGSDPGRRFVPHALLSAGVVSIALAALRPPPRVLAAGLSMVLFAVWADAFVRHARHGLPIARTQ